MAEIKAIDFMNYYIDAKIKARYEEARKGEIVCRMEASLSGGGFPAYTAEEMIKLMDEAGVEKVFLTAAPMFSYWSKKVLMLGATMEEVAAVVKKHPDRFVGIAGYNPLQIIPSLREIEEAVKVHSFKGVYVHIYGFDMPLTDRRMYPLYAKCQELNIPVSMQVGYVLEAQPSEHGRPIYLDRIALDFPNLKLIGAHTGYPWCEELISICFKFDNVFFGVDAHMPRYMDPSVVRYIDSRGRDKVIWGTNGLSWKPVLSQIDQLGLKEENKQKLLRENVIKLFKL